MVFVDREREALNQWSVVRNKLLRWLLRDEGIRHQLDELRDATRRPGQWGKRKHNRLNPQWRVAWELAALHMNDHGTGQFEVSKDTICRASPCRMLAVSYALTSLFDAAAVVTSREWRIYSNLRRLSQHQDSLDNLAELAESKMEYALPTSWDAAVGHGKALGAALGPAIESLEKALSPEIREELAPQGRGHPAKNAIPSVWWLLRDGGFEPHEIAKLAPDGESRSSLKDRIKKNLRSGRPRQKYGKFPRLVVSEQERIIRIIHGRKGGEQ